MTQVVFFAAPEDFQPLVEGFLADEGASFFEAYSVIGQPVRRFVSATEAITTLRLGHDEHGNGVAGYLGLWVPAVTPQPTIRRIDLDSRRFPPGSWRETTEGCGIFWLQTGGLHHGAVTASRLTAFTERSARAKCSVEPGPDAVDWHAHTRTTRRLTRLIHSGLAVAKAGRHPVFQGALDRHRSGARLLLKARGPHLSVEAA